MRKFIFLFSLLLSISISAQNVQLSVYSEVSILTSSPGDELFTAFGHTAIRIKDPVLQLDAVYNYGMFDFNQPNFYLNFAEGKLLYKLGAYSFSRYVQQNNYEKRWVKEQVLNLNQAQRQVVFLYLTENLKPQNASYLYDPFYDNCATKPIEILSNQFKSIEFNKDFISKDESIRTLMNDELSSNTWGSFGINLALGSKIDNEATFKDYLYLPKFVYKTIEKATIEIDGKRAPLVKKTNSILDFEERDIASSFFSPSFVFFFLLMIGVFSINFDLRRRKVSHLFDAILFGTTSIAGIGIVFLWFFTNHATTPMNLNILWCIPFHFLILILRKKPVLLRKYYIGCIFLTLSVLIVWALGFQGFNFYIAPLLGLLCLRYLVNITLLSPKQ